MTPHKKHPRAHSVAMNPIHSMTCACWRCLDAQRQRDLRIARLIGTLVLIGMLAMGAATGAIIRALLLWARP
jgi:hypothetical protein